MTTVRHWHLTRDVKPRGECAACDVDWKILDDAERGKRGQFKSKPRVHLLQGGELTACGLFAHRPRYEDGDYPATSGAWSEVECGSCKRTTAWKNAKGKAA